jgi:hypothetical protein
METDDNENEKELNTELIKQQIRYEISKKYQFRGKKRDFETLSNEITTNLVQLKTHLIKSIGQDNADKFIEQVNSEAEKKHAEDVERDGHEHEDLGDASGSSSIVKLPQHICDFIPYFCDFLDEKPIFYECYEDVVNTLLSALTEPSPGKFITLVTKMLSDAKTCITSVEGATPIVTKMLASNSNSLIIQFEREVQKFDFIDSDTTAADASSMVKGDQPPNYDTLIDGLRYCCLLKKSETILPNPDYMDTDLLTEYKAQFMSDLKKIISPYHGYIFENFTQKFLELFNRYYPRFDRIHNRKRDKKNNQTIQKFNAEKSADYKKLYDDFFGEMTSGLSYEEQYKRENPQMYKSDKTTSKGDDPEEDDPEDRDPIKYRPFREMFIYLINNIKTYFVLPQRKKSLQFFNMLETQHKLNSPSNSGDASLLDQSQLDEETPKTFVGLVPDIERALYQFKDKTMTSVDDKLLSKTYGPANVDILREASIKLSGNVKKTHELASERALHLGVNVDFMKCWFQLKTLIMNQLDLMHDIVIGDADNVWGSLDRIYTELLQELKKRSASQINELHIQDIQNFKGQMDLCWSKANPKRANQDRIKSLRGEMNDCVIKMLGLPVEDFKSQTLTRDEADAAFLNICGKNRDTAIAYIESGRAILFYKIKKRLDKLDETDIEDFRKLLDKEGHDLLTQILNDEVDGSKYYKKTNFNGLLDACLSTVDTTENGPKQIEFKKMFGKFTYSVTSNKPNGPGIISAKDIGHLVVVTDTYDPSITYAIYGLVGVASINSLTASFKKLGGTTSASRSGRESDSNISNGNIVSFCNFYNFAVPDIKQLGMKQRPNICAYFSDKGSPIFGLLTYGIKTICDEVVDAHIPRIDPSNPSISSIPSIRVAFTIDALVSQTTLAKWLEGYYVTLPDVFRSSGLSYVLHSGRAEEDLDFVAKKIVIKILSYYQIAIKLDRKNATTNLNPATSLALSIIADANVTLTQETIYRIHNLISHITQLSLLGGPAHDDEIYDKCYAAIVQKHAISFIEKLRENVTKMFVFLNDFNKNKDITRLRTNLDSLPGYESLLRFDIVKQYIIGQSSFNFDEFVGFTSADVFEVADVTPQNITLFIKGTHNFENLRTKLEDIPEFDRDEVTSDCQIKITGRQSGTSTATFFYKATYTYTIEFLMDVLKSPTLKYDVRVKIVYLVLKHLFDNYNMAGSHPKFDNIFLKQLNDFMSYAVAAAVFPPPPATAVSAGVASAAAAAAPPPPPAADTVSLFKRFQSIADVSDFLDILFNNIEFSGNPTTCGDNSGAAAAAASSATETGLAAIVAAEVSKHCPNDTPFKTWVVSQPITDVQNKIITTFDVKYEEPVKEAPDSNHPIVNSLRHKVSNICNPKTHVQPVEFPDVDLKAPPDLSTKTDADLSVNLDNVSDDENSDVEDTTSTKTIGTKRYTDQSTDQINPNTNKKQFGTQFAGRTRHKQTKGRKIRIKKFTRGLKKRTIKRRTKKNYRKKYKTIRNKITK